MHLVFDTLGQNNWMQSYLQLDPSNIQQRLTRWSNFVTEVIQAYQQYQIPIILLTKETPREAVCQVFEKVNTGGVFLTVFELLTASYAADDYNLREDWARRQRRLKRFPVLDNVQNTDFLQAVTLLATRSCTRRDILKLTLEEYKTWADLIAKGFEKAAKLLHTLKIFTAKDLPYQPQLTVLAAIFAKLGIEGDNAGTRAKLERWYWCGVFGEIYSGAVETRLAKDLAEVLEWINNSACEPDTINNASFISARLTSLRNRNSAAYKGLSSLLMRAGAYDFCTDVAIDTQMYFDEKIDIHHIFPQQWCKDQGINPKLWDSVLNKTPLSARTNRMLGGKAPSVYLPNIQNKARISSERMDDILRSHVIEPSVLRADNFYDFLKAREKALLDLIEKAMGKSSVSDTYQDVEDDTDTIEYDEELDTDEEVSC